MTKGGVSSWCFINYNPFYDWLSWFTSHCALRWACEADAPLNIILVTSFATTDEIHNSITRSTFSFETTSVDTSQLCATSKESSSFGSSMDTRRIRVHLYLNTYQITGLDFYGFWNFWRTLIERSNKKRDSGLTDSNTISYSRSGIDTANSYSTSFNTGKNFYIKMMFYWFWYWLI